MSKRVSNKKGGGGARSGRTRLAFLAKRRRRYTRRPVAPARPPAMPIRAKVRPGLFTRLTAPVRRFFRGG